MFKKFLPFLLIPGLLFSGEVKKQYNFSKPSVVKGIAAIPGCRLSRDKFAPSLSVKAVKLLVPAGQEAVSFDVNYNDPVYLEGTYNLVPYRPDGSISVIPPKDYLTRSSSVYDKNEFYPASVRSENFYTVKKNGHSIFVTVINPVQFNPVSGLIRYYNSVSVTVTTAATREKTVYKCNSFIKSQLMHLVDNPDAIASLPDSKTGPDDYEYLIVATDAIKDGFDTFIEFNKRRGMRTKVASIADIKSSMSGDDDPDKVRNYIKQEYENNNIVFVLLGGDDDNNNANDVPHRGLHSEMYDYGSDYNDDKDVAADMYFSCLDGTWKNSGDQYYGEFGSEDVGWEVYAARFAADNTTELNNIMNKTIKYSEQPVAGEAVNYLLLGEYAWGPPDHPVECWGGDCMDQLEGQCTANNFTTEGFPSSWNGTKLYDKNQTWSKSTLLNTVKNDKITWIDHVGHSNNTYIFKIYNSDVTNSNFTNDGTNANFFIGYTYGCYPGAFDNRTGSGSYSSTDCIAEQLTVGISNGCVAFVSNTRVGLGDDGTASADGTDGSSQRYIRYFHDAIFGKKIHYAEMMNAYSKEVNSDLICESDITAQPYFGQMKWCAYQLCLLGDPALSIWTAAPQELTADHPTTIAANATSFSWDTKKAYTTVALLDGARGDIIAAQITGEDGKCEITDGALTAYLAANPGGKLAINVKAHNFLPYAGEIQIGGTGILNNSDLVFTNNFYFSNKMSRINYSLPAQGFVNISIFNSKGSLIKTVVNKYQAAGDHFTTLSSSDLSNGIYYLRMMVNNHKLIKNFVITK